MMQDAIVGYMVVGKPGHMYWSAHHGLAQAGGKPYSGVTRLPWEDLELAYYGKSLEPAFAPIWDALKHDNRDFSGIDIVKSYAHAAAVQQAWPNNDIIAVGSAELARVKGTIVPAAELTFLGLDCVAFGSIDTSLTGEWSVVADGLHLHPEHFTAQIGWLNEHGLLTSDDACHAVFSRYVELSRREVTEPLADDAAPVVIQVFAVAPPR
jgi:hypothetical protein